MPNDMKCPDCGRPEAECVCVKCSVPSGGCCYQPGVCPCMHHRVMPILVILFGLTFLLQAFGVLSVAAVSYIWPVLAILGGVFKLYGGGCKCYLKHY
jgi:hypothetical protein